MGVHLAIAVMASITSSLFAFGLTQAALMLPTNDTREGKMFSLFSSSSDSINGDSCSSGTNFGICTSSSSCKSKGGTTIPGSSCSGRSVCCQIVLRCNATENNDPCIVRNSGTIIMHETGMTNYRRRYRYRRPKGACQLRLDFDEFSLAQPSIIQDCTTDMIQVGGLTLCGINRGQHAYFEFGESSRIDLNVRIQAGDTSRFSIRNTYIPCNSDRRAPANCLQYFRGSEGRVTSFNFLVTSSENLHLNNLDYSVCIEQADEMNQIQWRACPDLPSNAFFISGGGINVQPDSMNCLKDWVQVFGFNRYCGRGFPTTTSAAKPFLLNVHLDAFEGYGVAVPLTPDECTGLPITDPYLGGTLTCTTENGICTCEFSPTGVGFDPNQDLDLLNTGFCLDYVQLP